MIFLHRLARTITGQKPWDSPTAYPKVLSHTMPIKSIARKVGAGACPAPDHEMASHGFGTGHSGFGCARMMGGLVQIGLSTVHTAVVSTI